jgi:hypothetical protein
MGVAMRKAIVSLFAVFAVFFLVSTNASAQVQSTYYANVSPANETPPLDTGMGGLGVAVVTFNDDGTSSALIIESAFGYDTPITASHIHIGDAGVAGPVICPLSGSDFVNPVIGSCNFTVDQTNALLNGGLYLNIHTQAHPGGEVRDQLTFVQ